MAQKGIGLSRPSTAEIDLRTRVRAQRISSGFAPVGPTVPARLEQALSILLESYDYAQDLGCPIWEFAVEAGVFEHLRLTSSDWRWLCHKGLVDHARERTMAEESERSFRRGGVLRLTRRTCFVLTEEGVRFARQLFAGADSTLGKVAVASEISLAEPLQPEPLDLSLVVPTWDRDRQQLRVVNAIVKEFKLPAPNQEVILAAFQEENWPPRIDDPLSPQGEVDPKRRLHDTITSLNRNQKEPLMRFLGDGSGQGVRWEFTKRIHHNGEH